MPGSLLDRKRITRSRDMPRILFATIVGLIGFFAYIGGAVVLADLVMPLHWALQLAYFLIAGALWVVPAHFLVLWAARKL